ADLVGHHLGDKRGADGAVGDGHVVVADGDGGRQDAGDLVDAALIVEVDQIRVGASAARDRREGDLDAAGNGGTRRRERSVPGGGEIGALDDEDAALGDIRRVAGGILHGADGRYRRAAGGNGTGAGEGQGDARAERSRGRQGREGAGSIGVCSVPAPPVSVMVKGAL